MAKALRSKRRQPAFDRSELADLIFTPAVGTGVGSHLVTPYSQSEETELPLAERPNQDSNELLPTVVTKDVATLGMFDMSAVDTLGHRVSPFAFDVPNHLSDLKPVEVTGAGKSDVTIGAIFNVSTVVECDMTTVDTSESALHLPPAPSDEPELSGLGADHPSQSTHLHTRQITLWITENGELVPAARVKRIRLAQDVLNSAEESVYDTLWSSKERDERDRDVSRIIQAGYDSLMKRTRLSRKTIQRIIDRLIHKDFIVIEHAADIYQRTAIVYRVFSYRAVLERQTRKGRLYVAKIGPGFLFVRQLDYSQLGESDSPSHPKTYMSTGASSNLTTVPASDQATVANRTTPTVVFGNLTTVVPRTTILIEQDNLGSISSSSSPSKSEQALTTAVDEELVRLIRSYGHEPDDEIVCRLVEACKRKAEQGTGVPASHAEILYFATEKLKLMARISSIRNPVAFLASTVPKCFEGESFRVYRESERQRNEQERIMQAGQQRELERWLEQQREILADPNSSEDQRELARDCLGIDSTGTII